MPQKLTQATINKLVKGLITEAGELTFPEEATIDELNCVLTRTGARQRRKGLRAVPGTSALGFTYKNASERAYSYYVWKNAGGTTGLNLLALQVGDIVRFYDLSVEPINLGIKVSVDLSDFLAEGYTVAGTANYTPIFGGLIVAAEGVDTIFLNYSLATNTLTESKIVFRIRDFEWQSSYDELDRSAASSSVTDQRLYDTYNAGWYGVKGSAALSTYLGSVSDANLGGLGGSDGVNEEGIPVSPPTTVPSTFYPPLTHPWYSGKDSDGNFSKGEWEKLHNPSSVTGNGLFKLDFFYQDRATASGIPSLPVYKETNRFKAVATYAGRVWYAGLGSGKQGGKILFSQLVTNAATGNILTTLGQCLQINDPTSETLSDIIDTDGGVIDIPEASDIKILHSYNNSLFVFADNGIWVISGIDNRFSPASYTVNKISSIGIDSAQSFVSAEGVPFWWSSTSINTVSFDEGSGFPVVQDISIATVQSYFNDIGEAQRSFVFADYDSFNKKIFWWYPDTVEEYNRKNNALILDIPLQAFYPWKITATSSKYVVGSFFRGPSKTETISSEVTDDSLVTVTSASTAVTVNEIVPGGVEGTELLVVFAGTGPTSFYIGNFTADTFLDFTDQVYDTYFETGYFFAGDLLVKKQSPYVTLYLRSTEDGFTGNETDGYTAINPSGLIVKSYWDFKDTASSTQQAYRIKPFTIVNSLDLSNNQQTSTVVTTRLKMRGRGRSMRLRFEAESGKDFIFLGYSILVGINDRF